MRAKTLGKVSNDNEQVCEMVNTMREQPFRRNVHEYDYVKPRQKPTFSFNSNTRLDNEPHAKKNIRYTGQHINLPLDWQNLIDFQLYYDAIRFKFHCEFSRVRLVLN